MSPRALRLARGKITFSGVVPLIGNSSSSRATWQATALLQQSKLLFTKACIPVWSFWASPASSYHLNPRSSLACNPVEWKLLWSAELLTTASFSPISSTSMVLCCYSSRWNQRCVLARVEATNPCLPCLIYNTPILNHLVPKKYHRGGAIFSTKNGKHLITADVKFFTVEFPKMVLRCIMGVKSFVVYEGWDRYLMGNQVEKWGDSLSTSGFDVGEYGDKRMYVTL